MKLHIEEYLTADGRSPFRHWLDRLDVTVRVRIQARVLRFEDGNFGDHKSVGRGIWEARLSFGPGYRIYYGRSGNWLVLLLCGGDKGSQRRDITQAQTYWEEYVEHMKNA